MIEKFSESLSRKSLPTGAANIIQAKLEQKIKSNHFSDFKESAVPPSGVWVQQKTNRLKQQNKFTIEGFINNFIANITEHKQSVELEAESSSSTSFSSLKSDQTDTEILIDTEDSAEKDYRTVSRSLKSVIHKDFDYNSFLRHIEELQKECSLCAHGLSQATGLFTETVISSAIFPTNPESYFDYSCIGLTELTAHVGVMILLIWVFGAYYQIVLGVNQAPKASMYLKVVITLSTRANLCRQRFFSKSSTVSFKTPSPNRSSSVKKNTNRLFLMNELFDCLLIHNQHKKSGKLFAIEKLVEKLFQSADTATNVEKAITDINPPSLDVQNESEFEDEEDLVITSSSDFDDVKRVTLDYAQKDLTAKGVAKVGLKRIVLQKKSTKGVRALSAVCIMLILSWNTEKEVDADNIFEKLYCNSQESILL
ncbi:uncharacterized protein EV154DRAFT_476891 [Mucor mucedo]|uniref:uncharacterized protein n=1 Tax=Mucor mucedo TaxID=29922 RepID=UPI00222007AF|nr:uncharacterized protein EV154DRAFT_476891 [Mucor mucedo]KAI7896166.1 hypothetical protein EV154DRAFT_476891 [Mucor mucedo]